MLRIGLAFVQKHERRAKSTAVALDQNTRPGGLLTSDVRIPHVDLAVSCAPRRFGTSRLRIPLRFRHQNIRRISVLPGLDDATCHLTDGTSISVAVAVGFVRALCGHPDVVGLVGGELGELGAERI
jgi:hypothetical protein